MKKTLVSLLLVTSALLTYAQDVITTRTGEEIQSKVLKVNDAVVEYKEWSNQDGPTLTMNVSDIFMIKYQNGESDMFQPTTEENVSEIDSLIYYDKTKQIQFNGSTLKWTDAGEILKVNSEAYKVYSSGKSMAIVGEVLSYGGGFALGWGLGGYLAGNKNALKIGAVGTGVLLVALPLSIIGQKKVFSSFDIYNEAVTKSKKETSLSLGISEFGGLSLMYKF